MQVTKEPLVVFVKASPNEVEYIRSGPFADQWESLTAFIKSAAIGEWTTRFMVSEYLTDAAGEPREATHEDFSTLRTECFKSLEGKVVVAVGKAARALLGSRAHFYLPDLYQSAVRVDEFERKAKSLRKTLDRVASSCDQRVTLLASHDAEEQRPEGGTYGEQLQARIHKASDEKRVIYGVVLDPYQFDAHDDWIPPSEIESTAHEFLATRPMITLQHESMTDAQVVESFVVDYPSKSDYAKAMQRQPHRAYKRKFGDDFVHSGAWILGVRLTPELWEQYKRGDFAAFSIEGYAARVPVSPTVMPEVKFIEIGAVV